MKRTIAFLIGIGAAASCVAQIDLNRTVATVNGEEIKAPEYYHRMEYLPDVGKMTNGVFINAQPGYMALERLITERLLLQLAKEKGLYPSDAEVDAEVKFRTTGQPDMVKNFLASGGTEADLKYLIRIELAQFKLSTRGVIVTDQEVEKHYKENPSRFTVPRLLEVRIITVPDEATRDKVDADLKAGKAFADVAKQYSTNLSKVNGGQIPPQPIEAFPKEVQDAINKIKIGQSTAWIPTNGIFMKLFFEKAQPQKTYPLDATLKEQLKRSLMIDRGNTKPENNIVTMMKNMRAKSKIEITDKSFADTYKRMTGELGGG